MAHFPTEVPAAEFDLLIDVTLGRGDHSSRDIVCAGWCVGGFVLDKMFPEGAPVFAAPASTECPDGPAERVALLESAKAACDPKVPKKAGAAPVGAVPWAVIWLLVQQVVNQFLPSIMLKK